MFGFAVGFLLTSIAIAAGLQADSIKVRRQIEISYPDLTHLKDRPCAAEDPTPCALEAAALAQALANLEAARVVAEAAFAAWEACLDANPPNPEPGPGTPHTVELGSVLESVK
jgi:hypothetical protein